MKTLKFKQKSKIFTLLLALVMMFTSIVPSTVLASENNTETSDVETTVLVEETNSDYQEALKVLGLTEEEAKECNIYSVDVTPSSQARGVSIPNNSGFYYFPEFTFSEYNGGSYWTCNGTQLKWGFSWYGTYDSNYDLRLGVYLYRYPDGTGDEVDHAWAYNGVSHTSDWLSASKTDYRFRYYCNYLTQDGVGYATVRMYVATK